jgi:uncharacterized protein (DUF2132 family)
MVDEDEGILSAETSLDWLDESYWAGEDVDFSFIWDFDEVDEKPSEEFTSTHFFELDLVGENVVDVEAGDYFFEDEFI